LGEVSLLALFKLPSKQSAGLQTRELFLERLLLVNTKCYFRYMNMFTSAEGTPEIIRRYVSLASSFILADVHMLRFQC
jgi:hypothetical protein